MEFANPYEKIPPAPIPTAPFASRRTYAAGTVASDDILPLLTGGRRYRIHNVVTTNTGGDCICELWDTDDMTFGGIITRFYISGLKGGLATPTPVVFPPTGMLLSPNAGVIAHLIVNPGPTDVYYNINYSTE